MPHKKQPLLVERRADGQYALERGGNQRAIGLFTTQGEAIQRGKQMGEPVVAERVRKVPGGCPDKWRKV